MENELSDLALLAWRDEGIWRISDLDATATTDIGIALDALRAKQVNGGSIAMLAIDDSFFIIIRQIGMKMQMVFRMVVDKVMRENHVDVLVHPNVGLPQWKIGVDREPTIADRLAAGGERRCAGRSRNPGQDPAADCRNQQQRRHLLAMRQQEHAQRHQHRWRHCVLVH